MCRGIQQAVDTLTEDSMSDEQVREHFTVLSQGLRYASECSSSVADIVDHQKRKFRIDIRRIQNFKAFDFTGLEIALLIATNYSGCSGLLCKILGPLCCSDIRGYELVLLPRFSRPPKTED